ncbi:MAG TPA: hypothetical protein VEX86_06790 [Longimicrobium sp.]|nr:hypothetical protein [Longimicrobium sp.]
MADPQTQPPLAGVAVSPVTPAAPPAPTAAEERAAKKERDRYERLDILSKSLLPIAIALATGVFSYWQWQTEQDRQRAATEMDQRRLAAARVSDSVNAVSQQRLAVSQLVNSFVPSLVSDRATNRILALQAIAYVDTALGNRLATALATDSSAAVSVAAVNVRLAADYPFLPVVEQVFGPTGPSRVSATQALMANRTWMGDTLMVSALLDAAARDPANANGLFNTITILRSVPADVQRARRTEIVAFAGSIPLTLPTVRARADTLRRIVERR